MKKYLVSDDIPEVFLSVHWPSDTPNNYIQFKSVMYD